MGFLPHDVSLRKSYFDDCRGDRFEYVMFIWSTAVLKYVGEQKLSITNWIQIPIGNHSMGSGGGSSGTSKGGTINSSSASALLQVNLEFLYFFFLSFFYSLVS